MKNIGLKQLVLDIRFWIVLFFLIRLIGVLNPPLDPGHNWRQSFTLMLSRNIFEGNTSLLFPMVDNAGERSGILATEFPLFNVLSVILSDLFGYDHWYGRLINLLISSLGLYAFYLTLKRLFTEPLAFYSTLVLSTSIWFAYSQKIMPDTFSSSLILLSIYLIVKYLQKGKAKHLLFYFIFCSLGALSKIPSVCLLTGLLVLPFVRNIEVRRRILVYAATIIAGAICFWWYFIWNPELVKIYQTTNFFPRSLMQGFSEIIVLWPKFFQKFYFAALQSFIALVCLLAGIFILLKRKNRKLQLTLAITGLTFSFFILKTGSVFPNHGYYIIPFVPVMAFLVGYFLSQIPKKYALILVFAICAEGIANQQHHLFVKKNQLFKLKLEGLVNKHLEKGSLIIINGGDSYQDIYFAHRKGWSIDNAHLDQENLLDSLQQKGAHYLIIDKHSYLSSFSYYPLLYEGEDYGIYLLDSTQP